MNSVTVIGRITNDLEVRKVGQDLSVLSFSIALNERYGNNDETYFFDVTAWNKQADTIANYFKKGQRIGVSGRLKQERFQDKEGKNRSRVVIILTGFDFIEPKEGAGGGNYAPREGNVQNAPSSTSRGENHTGATNSGGGNYDFPSFPADQNFEDDEVPF